MVSRWAEKIHPFIRTEILGPTVKVEGEGEQADQNVFSFCLGLDELFSFDEEEIKSKLPVLPGHSTDITVTITGAHRFPQGTESNENPSYDPAAPWGLTGSIQFRYSTGSSSHMSRKVTMAIDVTVVPSLICESYQIIELPR